MDSKKKTQWVGWALLGFAAVGIWTVGSKLKADWDAKKAAKNDAKSSDQATVGAATKETSGFIDDYDYANGQKKSNGRVPVASKRATASYMVANGLV